MKAISQQVRYRRMRNNICTGLESMRTLRITPSDARNVSKGLKYPRSPSSLMTSQRVLGENLVLIILPSMATHVLICDYFSKFPFLYRAKTSFWSLRDRLIDLFSIEGYPDEIVSDNGPPFQGKEFAKFLSSLGIKHTTSSPGYPCSNGFIERHIQTVKNMLSKSSNTLSFQEVLADLRTTRIGNGLPSSAEILHGRNLTTRAQAEIDIKAIRSVLQERQLKMMLDHDSSRRAKKARPLVVGERCHVLGPGNKWIDAFVTGITDSGRSYETQVEATGKQLTRNRSHIRPRSPDIPHMHASFLQRNAVPSATSDGNAPSERQNSVIS